MKIRWQELALVLMGVALVVFAGPMGPDRTLAGNDLVRVLNGKDVFVNTISDTAGGTPTAVTVEAGANIAVICSNAGFVIVLPATDPNAVSSKMIDCAAGEKIALGFLGPSDTQVSYESASGAGTAKVFQRY